MVTHFFLVIMPLIVPVVPIITSCILSVYALIKSIDRTLAISSSDLNRKIVRDKKRVTLTVIVVTVIYIIFNIPPVVTVILYSLGSVKPALFSMFDFDVYFYYNNFQEIYCVGLNAMANPFIYLMLMPSYRKYLRSLFWFMNNDEHSRFSL